MAGPGAPMTPAAAHARFERPQRAHDGSLHVAANAFSIIGIVGKPGDIRLPGILARLVNHLTERGCRVLVDQTNAESAPAGVEVLARGELGSRADLVVVIGGDGTLLDAARTLAGCDAPLLGVNLGRLGFMVDVPPERMTAALDAVMAGEYQVDLRFLLEAEVIRGEHSICRSTALNDVVITKRDVARMVEFDSFIDGCFVSTHRADGLVVATPTGSTAYALSGGGPILHPALDALTLVPICPHTLSDRPLVISASSGIDIVLSSQNTSPVQVTWDGQSSLELSYADRVRIRRSELTLRLLHPLDHDYFAILRNKLHWGSAHNVRR